MPIQVASFIIPKAGNTWFVLEDKYIKGGLQVVPTLADRDAINAFNLKASMLVIVSADNKIWQLGTDLLTWTEFRVGSTAVRQSVTHQTVSLSPIAVEDFTLTLGKSVLVYSLSVDTPCTVAAYSDPTRAETNPYKFVATSSHLVDDGSTLMTDGTVLRGRRYSILCNLEGTVSSNIYFRVTNTDLVAKAVLLTIQFLPIEI